MIFKIHIYNYIIKCLCTLNLEYLWLHWYCFESYKTNFLQNTILVQRISFIVMNKSFTSFFYLQQVRSSEALLLTLQLPSSL